MKLQTVDRKRVGITAAVFSVMCLLILQAHAHAHGGATGIVKQRMDLMESVGDSMDVLKDIMRGKNDYDEVIVRKSADDIAKLAAQMLKLFPEGSLDHPTEAKAVIWEKWDEFSELARQMEKYGRGLSVAATNNPAIQTGQSDGMTEQGMTMGMTEHGTTANSAPVSNFHQMSPQAVFKGLSKVCKDCHTTFRIKKKNQ